MITYVNAANSDKYSAIFEKAFNDLQTHDTAGNEVEKGSSSAVIPDSAIGTGVYDEDGQEIKMQSLSSLDEYFSYIVELNNISRRYTILPLDEDVFEINANDRSITVPASFKKNGISVQGDEVSEIVYFRIARFYDSTDLDTKDIYIQWKSAAQDEDGNFIEGVSVPWVKDIESDPGYIIFGWPLSSKITQAAGTIQFAVRFYNYDKDTKTLNYSLSTLTCSATIKPGLDFDIPGIILDGTQIDDSTTLLHDRLVDSQLASGTVQAEKPIFIKDLVSRLILDDNGLKAYNVQAYAPDAGQLTYVWKKYDIDTNDRLLEEGAMPYEVTMSKISADETRVTGKLYYTMVSGSDGVNPSYQLYTGDIPSEDPTLEIYEKFSTGIFNSVGKYVVVAKNRVRQSTAETESTVCIVPRPLKVNINKDLSERGYLNADDYETLLTIKASVDDEGKITYQWLRKAPGADDFEEIEGATEATYLIQGSADESEESGGEGDGFYKVIVTNNLNKEIDSTDSGVCRVTHPATQLKVQINTTLSKQYFSLDEVKRGNGCVIVASWPEGSGEVIQRQDEDSVTYQWYKYVTGGNVFEDDFQKANDGEYYFHGDTKIEGANEKSFIPDEDGYYFCEVTNTYNDTQAKRCSPFFSIVDA
jgi:hypothetical protein